MSVENKKGQCPVVRVGGGYCEGGEDKNKCLMDNRYEQLKKNTFRTLGKLFRSGDAEVIDEQCKGCLFHSQISEPFKTYEAIKNGETKVEFDHDDNTMMNPWTSTK